MPDDEAGRLAQYTFSALDLGVGLRAGLESKVRGGVDRVAIGLTEGRSNTGKSINMSDDWKSMRRDEQWTLGGSDGKARVINDVVSLEENARYIAEYLWGEYRD